MRLPSYLCPFGKSRAAVELEQITTVEIVDSLGVALDGVDRSDRSTGDLGDHRAPHNSALAGGIPAGIGAPGEAAEHQQRGLRHCADLVDRLPLDR